MSRAEALIHHAAAALVGITGLAYFWTLWLAELPADEFGIGVHPLQGDFQHLHILTAPILIFASGLIWKRHAWARIKEQHKKHRRTGILLATTLLPMVLSGYLLQISVEEIWREIWRWVHSGTSGLWLLAYGIHQFERTRNQKA